MGRRKKKNQRGSNTHGHGSSKKNRGAGNRGGRGHAGSGKKGGQKKTSAIKEGWNQDKGFRSRKDITGQKPDTVNLGDLDNMLPRLKETGAAYMEDGDLVIDVAEAGYDKVLGKGVLREEATVKADAFSSGAKQKLESHGSTPVETGDSTESS